MFRRAWKPLATTVLLAPPAYLYYRHSSSRTKYFDVAIREAGPDGQSAMVTRSLPLLTKERVDKLINEHASLESQPSPSGLTWKYSTAHLSSNNPIEDANAQAIISRSPSALGQSGQLLFFAVMDGHGGSDTSRLLSKVLIPAVALELTNLINAPSSSSKPSTLGGLKSLLFAKPSTYDDSATTPDMVSQAIQRAFSNLDFEITNAPLRLLAANIDKTTEKLPDLSQHPMAMASILPAISGTSLYHRQNR